MSLFGGWLGAALPVLGAQRAGVQQGNMDSFLLQRKLQQEDEQRQREMQQAAMEAQLLQLRVDEAQKPQAWAPTSKEEYMSVHPSQMTTENIDPLSDIGISAALKRKRGEAAIDRQYPKPPSETQQSHRAQGQVFLDQYMNHGVRPSEDARGAAQRESFSSAFKSLRQAHPQMDPGEVAYAAVEGMKTANPAMFGTGDEFDYHPTIPVDHGANPTPPAPITPAPITHTLDPHTQEAKAQRWDELVQQGVDPEQAKQQVLREFGGQ